MKYLTFLLFALISSCASTGNTYQVFLNKYRELPVEKRLTKLVIFTDNVESARQNLVIGTDDLNPETKEKFCNATGKLISRDVINKIRALVDSLNMDRKNFTKHQADVFAIYEKKAGSLEHGKPLC